jgi:nucleoid-associated protein YgaU
MKRTHALAIAAIIAVVSVLGVVAVSRTTRVGAAAQHASDASLAARSRQLDRYAVSLRRALAQKQPALPALPAPRTEAIASPAPRIVYHRPPPVVVVTHRSHGDDGFESEHEGGGDD